MTKEEIMDLVTGKDGNGGYKNKWFNPSIYMRNLKTPEDEELYLRMSAENVFWGNINNNINFWISEMDSFGIPHGLKRIEPEVKQEYQLSLF